MASVFTNFNRNFSPRMAAYNLREKYVSGSKSLEQLANHKYKLV